MRVHFIGVGKMGLPMARHLLTARHNVTVSDPDLQRLRAASLHGLTPIEGDSEDLEAAVESAEVIVSSLPDDAALLVVSEWVGAAARRGAIYVDTSTVSIQASATAASHCTRRGVQYLRTTVSGNNKMAEAAQLTVMASGPRAAYDAVLPLLRALGPHQFYLGEAEEARLMKLVVNLMIAQTSAMLTEALTLGRKGGLDWKDMWQVLSASAVASPIVKAKGVQLAERDFTPTFTVEQMVKDLNLIVGAASDTQVPVPQTALTLQLMYAAMAQGDGALDYAAIIRVVERSAGLPPQLD